MLSGWMNTKVLPVADIVTAGSVNVDDVMREMNSDTTSAEEKTNFLIKYLLAQREPMLNFAKTALVALVVFLIGRKLIRLMLKLMNRWMDRGGVEISVQKFMHSVANVVLNILLIFIVAGILGVGTSSIVAIIGSAGLAVGLALQGSLSNFAGGVLILLLKPFRVGDYIVTSGAEGTVQNIDIFYTHLLTTDNKKVVIPNGVISNSNVVNTTAQESRLLIIDFMVGHEIKTQRVRQIVLEQLRKDPSIHQEQPMSVEIDKLNPGRVKMQAKAWVPTSEYWPARYRLLERIKESLEENGIPLM